MLPDTWFTYKPNSDISCVTNKLSLCRGSKWSGNKKAKEGISICQWDVEFYLLVWSSWELSQRFNLIFFNAGIFFFAMEGYNISKWVSSNGAEWLDSGKQVYCTMGFWFLQDACAELVDRRVSYAEMSGYCTM